MTNSGGSNVRKMLTKILVILFIILAAVSSFLYLGVYDEGVRAGKVLRVSKKGILFKTYEGQISIEAFGGLKGASPIAETFDFSIEKKRPDLIDELEKAALSGERVNLHYIKRYTIFPWRGETKYFVVKVERMNAL